MAIFFITRLSTQDMVFCQSQLNLLSSVKKMASLSLVLLHQLLETWVTKVRQKKIMGSAGIPLVPGCHGDEQDIDFMRSEAEKIGYPVLIKPTHGGGLKTNQLEIDKLKGVICHKAAEVDATRCDGRTPIDLEDEIFHLVSLQTISSFCKVEDGLMALLERCLELEAEQSTCILCSYTDHFQSTKSEDVGWGCGWHNIQMLSSHLLAERQEAKEGLFGGSGFVPDIVSLQRWLEISWRRGFDEV